MKKLFVGILILLSLKSFSQQKIYATIAGGDLYLIDISNCSRHFIGSSGYGFGDIAMTPNGKLWGIANGNIYQIDTTNANATLVVQSNVQGVSLVDLNDTTLLCEFGMKLYGINTRTADSFYIDTIGHQAAGDLTWYDKDLFMVTSGGQIVKMVFNSTYTAFTSVTVISSSNFIPTCEGATTAVIKDDYNSLIGFNGPNVLKICQLDGSYQMLCPNLNINGTPGSASLRLAVQNPIPSSCHKVSGIDNIKNDLSFFPNPTHSSFAINFSNDWNNSAIKVFNLTGQMIFEKQNQNGKQFSIDLSNQSAGIYFIEVQTATNIYRSKVVKE